MNEKEINESNFIKNDLNKFTKIKFIGQDFRG